MSRITNHMPSSCFSLSDLSFIGKGAILLPRPNFIVYTIKMEGLSTAIILILVLVVLYIIGLRWWRHRRAAKLADKLLAEVIKGKDSFRR